MSPLDERPTGLESGPSAPTSGEPDDELTIEHLRERLHQPGEKTLLPRLGPEAF